MRSHEVDIELTLLLFFDDQSNHSLIQTRMTILVYDYPNTTLPSALFPTLSSPFLRSSRSLDTQIIYLRATGGEVGASSALAPKIGPLGLVSDRAFILGSYCSFQSFWMDCDESAGEGEGRKEGEVCRLSWSGDPQMVMDQRNLPLQLSEWCTQQGRLCGSGLG